MRLEGWVKKDGYWEKRSMEFDDALPVEEAYKAYNRMVSSLKAEGCTAFSEVVMVNPNIPKVVDASLNRSQRRHPEKVV